MSKDRDEGPKIFSSDGLPEGWIWKSKEWAESKDGKQTRCTVMAVGPNGKKAYMINPETGRPLAPSNRHARGTGSTWEEAISETVKKISEGDLER